MEYNVSIKDSVFKGFGRCLCTHTHKIHTEMHIYNFGTQKHIHSIMDTEIQLWIHVKNAHKCTPKYTYKKRYTNLYKSTH